MPITERPIAQRQLLPELLNNPQQNTVLQSIVMSNMIGILAQLGELAEFGASVLSSIYNNVNDLGNRVFDLTNRAKLLSSLLPVVEGHFRKTDPPDFYSVNKGADYRRTDPISCGLFTNELMPTSIAERRAFVPPPPRLDLLNDMCDNTQSCMKSFSDPTFFLSQWMLMEKIKQEKREAERAEGKKKRREEKQKKKKRREEGKRKEVGSVKVKQYNQFGQEYASGNPKLLRGDGARQSQSNIPVSVTGRDTSDTIPYPSTNLKDTTTFEEPPPPPADDIPPPPMDDIPPPNYPYPSEFGVPAPDNILPPPPPSIPSMMNAMESNIPEPPSVNISIPQPPPIRSSMIMPAPVLDDPTIPKPPPTSGVPDLNALLLAGREKLKKATFERFKKSDGRDGLLSAIKQGVTLKKVERIAPKVEEEKSPTILMMLKRRVMLEQESDEEDDGEFDDNGADEDDDWV